MVVKLFFLKVLLEKKHLLDQSQLKQTDWLEELWRLSFMMTVSAYLTTFTVPSEEIEPWTLFSV